MSESTSAWYMCIGWLWTKIIPLDESPLLLPIIGHRTFLLLASSTSVDPRYDGISKVKKAIQALMSMNKHVFWVMSRIVVSASIHVAFSTERSWESMVMAMWMKKNREPHDKPLNNIDV